MSEWDHPRELLSLSNDVIAVVDDDMEVQFVTRAVERILGVDPATLVGTDAYELIDETDRDRVRSIVEEVRDRPGESTAPFEYRSIRNDGETVWMESTVTNRCDTVLEGYVVVSRDVSDRKQAEWTARESREYLTQLAENTTDVLWLFDRDWETVLFVNSAYEDVYGRPVEELRQRPASFLEAVHPEDRDRVTATMGRLSAGETVDVEYRVDERQEYERWVWVQATPIYEDGEVTRIAGFSRDVTQRKQQAEWFRALIENAMDVMAVIDPDGRITYVTPSVRRVLGYDPEQLVGRQTLDMVHPEDRARVAEALDRVVDGTGRPVSREFRFRTSDGGWRGFDALANNQLANPAVEGIVVNLRDVSERQERERQLRVLDRVLRHNAHNDLGVVLGYAEVIANDADGELAEFAQEIADQSISFLDTIDKEREIVELLTQQTDVVRVDAAEAVRNAVTSLVERYPTAAIDFRAPGSTPVRAASNLELAIEEVVENAIVHHDRPPWIDVTVERRGDTVRIQVEDDGPGIPDNEIGVLLDEYEIDPLFHGSGMGLWLVRWIVTHSGGELSFEENQPRGSVITITLDAVE